MSNIKSTGETSGQQLRPFAVMALAALGVAFGDIGTSLLYAFKLLFNGDNAISASPDHVLDVLSLIFWALIIVVTVKYLLFVLMADNNGRPFSVDGPLRPRGERSNLRRCPA